VFANEENVMIEQSIFTVTPSEAGKWDVKEDGFEKPISYFEDKTDAIEYATALAKTKANAQVKINNESGSLEIELAFTERKQASGEIGSDTL